MYDLLFILFKFCLDGTTNVMPFCLPANVYIEFICIIAGTLSMFSARGCVPDIRHRECTGNTVLYPYTAERRDVLENTLPEAQEISQGRGFCTPRPKRLPEGEARGQSRGAITHL